MTQDRFSICLPFTLAQECQFPDDWTNPKNFSNDAHDPGGETMCGIIQREYDAYRKAQDLLCQDVRKLTKTEGMEIYCANYWLPYCPTLPPGLDLQFFDSSVNEGCTEATKILQYVLRVPVDGVFGPVTAAEVRLGGARVLVPAFTERRAAVYKEMRGFQYFGKDWERRTAEIGAEALKMAA